VPQAHPHACVSHPANPGGGCHTSLLRLALGLAALSGLVLSLTPKPAFGLGAGSAFDLTVDTLFYADFEGDPLGATPPGWTVSPGAGGVVVKLDGINQVLSDGLTGGAPVTSGGNWADVSVSHRFKTISGGLSHPGLIARYQDDSNMVYGGIITATTAEIWNRIGGTWTQIGGTWTIPDVSTGWHEQELRVFDDRAEVYIDGSFIGAAAIMPGAPGSGSTGFWSQYGAREGYRDDHLVRSLSQITGTVFEDVNYGGGAGRSLAGSGGSVRSGAKVELYDAAGAFADSTTTDGSGQYSFTVVDGSYTVRVVNQTVTSSRTGYVASLRSVQTFRTDASSGTAVAVTDRVGGEIPHEVDPAINTTDATLAALNGVAGEEVQSLAPVTVGGADVTGVDFGFNFSTIVSTNDAGQGSLRQFIDNASTLGGEGSLAQSGSRKDVDGITQSLPAGYESSVFMISDGGAHPGLRLGLANQLTGGVAVITPAAALPGIAGANTVVDGTTQTVNVGNTNPAVLGAGGTVGVNGLSLRTIAGPEVEILGTGTIASGLVIQANDVIVRGLSIHGFGSASGEAGVRVDAVANALIEGNVLGSGATAFTDPGAPQRNQAGVHSVGGSSGTVSDNLIGFGRRTGVYLGSGSTGWAISGNEIRDSGMETADGDGITVNASSTNTASGNLITGSSSQGVAVTGAGTTNNTFVNNTITGNGVGTASSVEQSAAVTLRSGPTSTTLDRNVIRTNYGAGVAVNNGATGTRMTRNSFELNGTITARNGGGATGQIGIDLNSPTDDNNFGTSPFYTANENGDSDTGGNNLFNFPFIEGIGLDLGTDSLEITGFARPGSVIELFVAAVDPSGFGEGQTYLVTLVEGGVDDLDSGTGSYTHAQAGSDNTNRFRFKIDNPGGVAVGTSLTATATDAGNNTSEFSLNVEVVEAQDLFFSSAADQTFWVGKASTAISPITVGEGSPTAITDATDIRIRIPSGFDMVWDTLDLTPTLTGTASGKVSPTVSYEDAGATLVLDVTSDFAFGDTIVIADLSFMDFTSSSGSDNLELELGNDGGVSATDARTIEILAEGTPTISSEYDLSFRVGDPPINMEVITIREDAAAPAITAANDIRVRIPSTFNMTWNTSDVSALLLGTALSKVSNTVSYEDGGKTLVIDVLNDFDPGDILTIAGLSYNNFSAASIDDHLELEVDNDDSVVAEDDKIIFIVLIMATPDIASAANQNFVMGSGPTNAKLIRITDDDVIPQTKADTDLRIRIPSAFPMTWDVTRTSIQISGAARTKCSELVTYEDGGKTLVIDVITDFEVDDWINVGQVYFANFTSAAPPDRLELEVANDGGSAVSVDDKTKEIFGAVFSLDVWPESVVRSHLATNGSNETVQFTVSNTGSGTDDYDLLTSTNPGTVITVVSITGPGITQGANPDSARVSGLGASNSTVVTVTYSAAVAPVGTADTLFFLARSVAVPADTDDGRLELTLLRPQITMGKVVSPNGTQLPGTDLAYTVTVTNTGSENAAGLVAVDSLAAELDFQVGSVDNTLPPGVTVIVEYSNDGGGSWVYSPTSSACGATAGYDRCVNRIRWRFQNDLSFTAPDNVAQFEFVARIG